MRTKDVIGLLSIGIIIAAIAGLVISINYVIVHRYIQYQMHWLIALTVCTCITRAIVITVAFLIMCFISWPIAKLVWKSLIPGAIRTVAAPGKVQRNFAAYVLCFFFFVAAGAAANHYLIRSYRWFHPVSILYDVVLLLATVLLGLVLVRVRSESIFRYIETKKVRRASVSIVVIVVMLNVCIQVYSSIKRPEGPNIIFITVETLRADHLSCYGYARKTTPAIDSVAKRGVLFSNMFAQRALTWPSLASIMTSSYPVDHGVRDNGQLLSPSILTMAEILKNNGYRCGAFLAHGVGANWKGFDCIGEALYRDKEITERAIGWLKNNFNKKIFMWMHYWEPHRPYQPPEPYDSLFDPDYKGSMNGSIEQMDLIALNKTELDADDLNHMVSLYDGSILFVDDQIKRVIETIKELGLEKNSLIIISADHGEDLYQHNCYFNHYASIYDSSLRIPFIIKLQDGIPENKQIDEVVESINIAPTILELARIPVPGHFEGRSLVPLIYSKNDRGDFKRAYSEWEDKMLSVRTDKYRYIYNPCDYHPRKVAGATEHTYPVEREELYDILEDPGESDNIVSASRDVAEGLMNDLKDWNNFQFWTRGIMEKAKEAPEHVKRQLRAVGYL